MRYPRTTDGSGESWAPHTPAEGQGQVCGLGRSVGSPSAVDGDSQGRADVAHLVVAEHTQPLDEHRHRDALDGVEVDGAQLRNWILARIEDHFAPQPADVRRARRNESAAQPQDGDVT